MISEDSGFNMWEESKRKLWHGEHALKNAFGAFRIKQQLF